MTQITYQAEPAAVLCAAELDGLSLLYHRPSGQTHIMVEPMPQILAALDQRPMTAAELMTEFDVSPADQPLLQARLDELLTTGLIAAR